MSRFPFILLLVFAAYTSEVSSFVIPLPSFDDIKTILKFGKKVFDVAKTGYDKYKTWQAKPEDAQKRMLQDMAEATKQLKEMKYHFEQKLNVAVETLLKRLPTIAKLDSSIKDLHDRVVRIDSLYKSLEHYTKNGRTVSTKTLKEYVETVTSHKTGDVIDSLAIIEGLILPGRTSNLRESLLYLYYKNSMDDNLRRCNDPIPPQLRIYEIYSIIVLTEIRAYTILTFAYTMEAIWERTSYESELKKAESNMALRCEKYLKATKEAMIPSPRDIRSCDPTQHIRDNTFIELERLSQAFITNELDMTGFDCKSCNKVSLDKHLSCRDAICPGEFQFCGGNVYECWYAGGPMEICRPPTGVGHRRYTYFKDSSGRTWGENRGCSSPSRLIFVKSFFNFAQTCNYCFCTCWEQWPRSPPELLWVFNLMPQLADWKKNMVLTGVRFVRYRRIVSIQIKQGKLLPSGAIDPKTDQWLPVPKIEHGNKLNSGDIEYYAVINGKRVPLKLNTDYTFVGRNTEINLDDIIIPKSYVAVGVQLMGVPKPYTLPIANNIILVVIARKFDFLTGKVDQSVSGTQHFSGVTIRILWNFWYEGSLPEIYKRGRSELSLGAPHDPLKSELNSPDSVPNQYMRFRSSDWERDAGQGTVPFFDGQEITMRPSLPLSGISLYHKGASGYGGFLALKVIALDFSNYLQTDIPSSERQQYELYAGQPLLALNPKIK